MKIQSKTEKNDCNVWTSLKVQGYQMPCLVVHRKEQSHFFLLRNTMFPPYKNPQPKIFSLSPKERGLLRILKLAYAFLVESVYISQYTIPCHNLSLIHSTELPLPVREDSKRNRNRKWGCDKNQSPCLVSCISVTLDNYLSYYYSFDGVQIYPKKRIGKIDDNRPLVQIGLASSHYNEIVTELFDNNLVVYPDFILNPDIPMAMVCNKLPNDIEIVDF